MTDIGNETVIVVAVALALLSIRELFAAYGHYFAMEPGPAKVRAKWAAHGALASVIAAPFAGWLVADASEWTVGLCIVGAMGLVTMGLVVKRAIAKRLDKGCE